MTYIILKPGRDMGKWGQAPAASRIQRLFFPRRRGLVELGSCSRLPQRRGTIAPLLGIPCPLHIVPRPPADFLTSYIEPGTLPIFCHCEEELSPTKQSLDQVRLLACSKILRHEIAKERVAMTTKNEP